jgi:hypothetical protein
MRRMAMISAAALFVALAAGTARAAAFNRGDGTCRGSSGDDVMTGSGVRDIISALNGNDRVDAGNGDELVEAGSGMDTVTGGPGNDELRGHYDVDDLDCGTGQDRLRGGFANDTINASDGGADTIDCGKEGRHRHRRLPRRARSRRVRALAGPSRVGSAHVRKLSLARGRAQKRPVVSG